MSALKAMDASAAYSQALGKGVAASGGGMSARESLGSGGFGDMLKSVVSDVAATTKASEQASVSGLNKQMDMTDVISAVSNAEMVLDTVVAVRDKVIQAYQEIVRMPI